MSRTANCDLRHTSDGTMPLTSLGDRQLHSDGFWPGHSGEGFAATVQLYGDANLRLVSTPWMNHYKAPICNDLPTRARKHCRWGRPCLVGISSRNLRLIRTCLKLFVSVCFCFATGCAVSFRTVIIHTHAE